MALPATTPTAFSITIAALADAGSGDVGRGSLVVDNTANGYLAATVSIEFTTSNSATPDEGGTVDVYLLRDDNKASGDIVTDGWGGTDAAWTRVNAKLLGSVRVTADQNTLFSGFFDTWVLGALGPKWGIGVVNHTGEDLKSGIGVAAANFAYYNPDTAG